MKGEGHPDNASTCPVSTIHYLTGPSDPAFEERRGDCGQEPPAPQNSKSQTTPANDLPSRPDALPKQRPPCLPFPTFPRSSRECLSPQGPAASGRSSPFLVASLATFTFYPWGQSQMSPCMLAKALLLRAITLYRDL